MTISSGQWKNIYILVSLSLGISFDRASCVSVCLPPWCVVQVNSGARLLRDVRYDLNDVVEICEGRKKQTNYLRSLLSDLAKGVCSHHSPFIVLCVLRSWFSHASMN